ncbi:Ftsk gamma domain protein [compost metagenome]
MERQGLVSAADSNGGRDVLMPAPLGGSADLVPEPLHSPDEQAEQLYQNALSVVLEDQKADAGWLQMRFAIGQDQANTLLDRMRQEGFISEPDEEGKYAVLKKPDQSPAIDPTLSLE